MVYTKNTSNQLGGAISDKINLRFTTSNGYRVSTTLSFHTIEDSDTSAYHVEQLSSNNQYILRGKNGPFLVKISKLKISGKQLQECKEYTLGILFSSHNPITNISKFDRNIISVENKPDFFNGNTTTLLDLTDNGKLFITLFVLSKQSAYRHNTIAKPELSPEHPITIMKKSVIRGRLNWQNILLYQESAFKFDTDALHTIHIDFSMDDTILKTNKRQYSSSSSSSPTQSKAPQSKAKIVYR